MYICIASHGLQKNSVLLLPLIFLFAAAVMLRRRFNTMQSVHHVTEVATDAFGAP